MYVLEILTSSELEIEDFAQQIRKQMDYIFYIKNAVTEEKVSYATILDKTCRLAESLQKFGIGQNNVIGISSENSLYFFYPVIAAMYLGITVTTFNSTYTPREILHCANISKPSIIFCSKTTLSVLLNAKKQMKFVRKVVIIDAKEAFNGIESLEDFVGNNLGQHSETGNFKPVEVDTAEQVAFILYSSGTTGLPKGVMLTHRNVTAANMNARDSRFYKQTEPGTGCTLGLLPFYHSHGLLLAHQSLLCGIRLIVLKKFIEPVFLKTIQDYKMTHLSLVPPLVVILAKSPLVDKYDLSNIEEITCASAPLSKEVQEIVKIRLKLKFFQQAYGMTETSVIMALPYGEDRFGSCGKLFPYVSAKVVDPRTGSTLGPRQRGELCFKGDQIMKGYLGNIKATRQTIDKDGWLSSGDVGYYDEEGYFYIVDRLKELIKYKSFQVPPAELEALLLTHPKIKDAAVVGLPDELAGELPVAFVVKQSGQNLTEGDVKNFVASTANSYMEYVKKLYQNYLLPEGVAPHKRLRGGVRFVDEIPKTSSGKLLRKRLRELLLLQNSKL